MEKVNFSPDVNYTHLNVGDLLNYVKDNDIPKDATIIVEHVDDCYLKTWHHYISANEFDGIDRFNPIGNGFGYTKDKKFFILWNHY